MNYSRTDNISTVQYSTGDSNPRTRSTWPTPNDLDKTPKVLDLIGCERDLTVCGHVNLIRRLPLRNRHHLQLVERYLRDPGSYEGRTPEPGAGAGSGSGGGGGDLGGKTAVAARLTDYGHGYVSLSLSDDVTRPELSEFLLGKGWKMIGFATSKEHGRTSIVEKWCNIRDV